MIPTINTKQRRAMITEIIGSPNFEEITSQTQLIKIIYEKYQVKINQGTISKDFKKLGIIKSDGRWVFSTTSKLEFKSSPKDTYSSFNRLLKIGFSIVENNCFLAIKIDEGLEKIALNYIKERYFPDEDNQKKIFGSITGNGIIILIFNNYDDLKRIKDDLINDIEKIKEEV